MLVRATPPRYGSRVRRRIVTAVVLLVVGFPALWVAYSWLTFPPDTTPEGAYLRILHAVNKDRPQSIFAYTETPAQHACFTTRNYRKASREKILATYPEPERSREAARLEAVALAPDGPDVFAIYARERGWMNRLRQDVSGIEEVKIKGDRATVVTVRGTRYPFRRRENGIWGITLFTATLMAEAQKAARDHKQIEKAAADYQRAK